MFEYKEKGIPYDKRKVDKYYLPITKKNLPEIIKCLENLSVKSIKNINNEEIVIIDKKYRKYCIKPGNIFTIKKELITGKYLRYQTYKLNYFFQHYEKVEK